MSLCNGQPKVNILCCKPLIRSQPPARDAEMEVFPAFQKVREVWQSAIKSETGHIPYKKDLPLARLGRLLSNVILFEIKSIDEITYRVTGTGISDLFYENRQGWNLLDRSSAEARINLNKHYAALLANPFIRYFEEIMHFPSGRQVRSSTISLPLLNELGDLRYIFTYMDYSQEGFLEAYYPENEMITKRTLNQLLYEDIGYGLPGRDATWIIDRKRATSSEEISAAAQDIMRQLEAFARLE